MNLTGKKLVAFLSLVAFLGFFAACGDPVESGANSSLENQQPGDGDTDADGDADGEIVCPDGQVLNPFSGVCTDPESTGDGDGEPEECEADEVFNPQTGQCEFDGVECEPGEVYNPDTKSCEVDQSECAMGAIIGQACAPSGQHLASANVAVTGLDCLGRSFTLNTMADSDGNYHFPEVPPGHHELLVSSGSFSGERNIDVQPGQTTDLSGDADKICVSAEDVKIMVFQGSNESMTTLLTNLGLPFDSIASAGANTANLLMDLPSLLEYDILMFECNHLFSSATNAGDRTQIVSNLQTFVQQGNSLYAADNAYQWVDEPFPSLANFGGTTGSEVIMAEVMSTEMLSLLGTNQVEIDFDLGGMRVIDDIVPPTVLHLRGTRGNVANRPLMFTYRDPINNGTVIYTSFHSSAQGTASEEILDILYFLIFQL